MPRSAPRFGPSLPLSSWRTAADSGRWLLSELKPGFPFTKLTTNLVKSAKRLIDAGFDTIGAVRRRSGGG
jgi:hypothetical protein